MKMMSRLGWKSEIRWLVEPRVMAFVTWEIDVCDRLCLILNSEALNENCVEMWRDETPFF